jgi:O-methyltransferase involved in polyketide biosynthesis
LGESLAGCGFQPHAPAFFTWLGVVPYLKQDAIGSTLDCMASVQNSEVVFDYMVATYARPFDGLRQLERDRYGGDDVYSADPIDYNRLKFPLPHGVERSFIEQRD